MIDRERSRDMADMLLLLRVAQADDANAFSNFLEMLRSRSRRGS